MGFLGPLEYGLLLIHLIGGLFGAHTIAHIHSLRLPENEAVAREQDANNKKNRGQGAKGFTSTTSSSAYYKRYGKDWGIQEEDGVFWAGRNVVYQKLIFVSLCTLISVFSMLTAWAAVNERVEGENGSATYSPSMVADPAYTQHVALHIGFQIAVVGCIVIGAFLLNVVLMPLAWLGFLAGALALGFTSDIIGLINRNAAHHVNSLLYIAFASTHLAILGISGIVFVVGFIRWYSQYNGSAAAFNLKSSVGAVKHYSGKQTRED